MVYVVKKDSVVDIKQKNTGRFGVWHYLLIICLLHEVPLIGYIMPAVLYGFILMLFFIITAAFLGTKFFSFLLSCLPIFFVFFLNSLLNDVPDGNEFAKIIYSFAQIMVYPIAGLCLMSDNNINVCKKVLAVTIAIYMVTAVTTIAGNVMYPGASRNLAGSVTAGSAEYALYMVNNIGGFSFTYILALMIPMLILGLKLKALDNTVLVILAIVLFAASVIYAEYTTAILILTLAFMLFFVRLPFTSGKFWLLLFLCVIGMLVARSIIILLMDILSTSFASEDVVERLKDMSVVLSGGFDSIDTESDVSQRSTVMRKSWEVFLQNPIMGSWSNAGIGGHSLFLDTLGRFGVLGLIAFVFSFRRMKRLFILPFRDEAWYGFLLMMYMLVFLLTVMNTHIFYVVLCYIVPLMASIYLNHENCY